MYAALLSGEHATLPEAELRALLAVHCPEAEATTNGRVVLIDERAGVAAALERAVYVLAWGTLWAQGLDSDEGLAALAGATATDGVGSMAVRVQRFGHDKSRRANMAARTIGAALANRGHPINLQSPDVEAFVWLGSGQAWLGQLHAQREDSGQERAVENRSHFSPIGLHPRLARALIHLAQVSPGGRIMDPFCGTGGIALESAMAGYETWASDLDPWMVQGTLQTLTDAGPEPLDGVAFCADIAAVPDLVPTMTGIVADLPYGVASSTHDEQIGALYRRALEAFSRMLVPGGRAVIGCADPSLLECASEYGFRVEFTHAQYVHRSLTRHFVVVKWSP